ncbi:hypothetical protein AAFN85_09575 [Mucilaginibacter sp. CAU 1740]|uniref:hypothetical protein n=1 Tax=Mucilaginibacter sp. CAU 1740 TaxID=3140365 RepID=UPI00325C2F72
MKQSKLNINTTKYEEPELIKARLDLLLDKFGMLENHVKPANNYSPRHIFHDLERAFEAKLSKNEILTMFYNFLKFEESLQCLKRREFHSGEYIINNIINLNADYNPAVRAGMDSLFMAVVAYNSYVKGNHQQAIAELSGAIEKAEEQGKSFPMFYACIQEQWLNKVRVYYKKKDFTTSLAESVSLIVHSLTGRYRSNPDVEQGYLLLSSDTRHMMQDHILNNILRYLSDIPNESGNDFSLNQYKQQLVTGLAQQLIDEPEQGDNQQALSVLSELYNHKPEAFITGVINNFNAVLNANNSVQHAIFSELEHLFMHFETEVHTHQNYQAFLNYSAELNPESSSVITRQIKEVA